MADVRHVRPDLVSTTGMQQHLAKREGRSAVQNRVFRDDLFFTVVLPIADADGIRPFILAVIGGQHGVTRLRRALYRAQIELFDLSVANLLIHHAQRPGIFGGDDDSAGVAVDAVAQRGSKAVFFVGIIFAFFIQVALHAQIERVAVVAAVLVTDDADLFVQDQKILILIEDIRDPAGLQKVVVLLPGKEFVADIQRQNITLVQKYVRERFFAVELDIFCSQVFVQQRTGHRFEALRQVFVQALSCVVLFDRDFSHMITASIVSKSAEDFNGNIFGPPA